MGTQNVALEMEQQAEWASLATAARFACYSISCATFCIPIRYILILTPVFNPVLVTQYELTFIF